MRKPNYPSLDDPKAHISDLSNSIQKLYDQLKTPYYLCKSLLQRLPIILLLCSILFSHSKKHSLVNKL